MNCVETLKFLNFNIAVLNNEKQKNARSVMILTRFSHNHEDSSNASS